MDYIQLLADYASAFNQTNRLLRLYLAENAGLAPDALLPEQLQGREQLSTCYRYTLTCLSPNAGLELNEPHCYIE